MEFVFTDDPLLMILAGILVLLIGWFAWRCARYTDRARHRRTKIQNIRRKRELDASLPPSEERYLRDILREDSWNRFVSGVAAFAVAAIVVSVMQVGWYHLSKDTTEYPSVAEAAQETFGLTAGYEYPLVTGSLISGTTTSVSSQSGLFHHSVSVNSQLSTGFMVDFVTDDARYAVLIPSDNVTYITVDVAPGEERIVMELSDEKPIQSYGIGYYAYECENKVVDLLVTCVNDEVSKTFVPQARSLSDITKNYLIHTTVYMTESTYETLFGFTS